MITECVSHNSGWEGGLAKRTQLCSLWECLVLVQSFLWINHWVFRLFSRLHALDSEFLTEEACILGGRSVPGPARMLPGSTCFPVGRYEVTSHPSEVRPNSSTLLFLKLQHRLKNNHQKMGFRLHSTHGHACMVDDIEKLGSCWAASAISWPPRRWGCLPGLH